MVCLSQLLAHSRESGLDDVHIRKAATSSHVFGGLRRNWYLSRATLIPLVLTYIGGLCGFDLVQNEFEKWMETTFDESYTSLPMSLRGPGSSFALEFEALKNQLDEIEQDGPETYLLHLPMSCSGHELFLEEEKYVQLNR